MVSLSMLEQSKAMAPPARRDRALISSGTKPSVAGPTAFTADFKVVVMSLLVTK